MARIFLSYAHEDAAKAKSLAGSLERGGHSVWWDPHVGGGARFAAEIATELHQCEIVIVLWSRHSINSSWVLDEAAEGRDSGKLVPIQIDTERPPLGFRQFQAIDLAKWSGHGRLPKLAAIEAAIASVLKGGTLAIAAQAPRRGMWHGRVPLAIAAAVALLMLVAAGLYASGKFTSQTTAASLAVLPFADLSPAKDKKYFADGVAEEIRTSLATVPGVRIVGKASIEMLGRESGLDEVRKQLGVTHMLEGSLLVQGRRMRLDVRLLRTADGLQIWAERFDRDLNDIFDVQREVGTAVADRLRSRLWRFPLAERSAPTSLQVYDLVLASRSRMSDQEGGYEAALESNRLAAEATRLDPNYAPAWVERSKSIYAIDQSKPEGQWGPAWPARYTRALQYAKRAVELDPKGGDAQAFLGWVEAKGERPELALSRIRKAMALNPGESSVWGIAGIIYGQMCDRQRQLEVWRRYDALEPLGPEREDLILALYALDQDAEADALRRKLSRKQSQASLAVSMAVDRGDFSSALRDGWRKDGKRPQVRTARLLHALGKTEAAFNSLPSGYRDSLGAYWQRDYAMTAAQTAFITTAPWNNLRTYAIERALVWTGNPRKLVDIFEKRFGSVSGFDRAMGCQVVTHAMPLVRALQAVGRTDEANKLINLAEQRYRQLLSSRDNEPEQHRGFIELLIATGRHDEALAALEQALGRKGARGSGPPVLLIDAADPMFDPIRNHRRFKAVERRIADWRTKELRELAEAGFPI